MGACYRTKGGLRPRARLSSRQNPFGSDDVDFDITGMLEKTCANAQAMLDDAWVPQCTDLIPKRPSRPVAVVAEAQGEPDHTSFGAVVRAASRAKRTHTSHARIQGGYDEGGAGGRSSSVKLVGRSRSPSRSRPGSPELSNAGRNHPQNNHRHSMKDKRSMTASRSPRIEVVLSSRGEAGAPAPAPATHAAASLAAAATAAAASLNAPSVTTSSLRSVTSGTRPSPLLAKSPWYPK